MGKGVREGAAEAEIKKKVNLTSFLNEVCDAEKTAKARGDGEKGRGDGILGRL